MSEKIEKKKPGKYKGGRPKIDFRTASKESYEKFISDNPKINISFKQYVQVIREINLQYSLFCLETGNIVKFPFGLGCLAINKKKRKSYQEVEGKKIICLPVNWKETLKEGKRIFHLNEHTEGYSCKWYWFRSTSRIKLVEIWHFKPSKQISNLLKDFCFDSEKKYYLKYREYSSKANLFK